MSIIQDNLQVVQQRIEQACQEYHQARPILLAVSKTRTAAEVAEAFALGLRSFGENYLQEALTKQQSLQDLPIDWHFIGPIQSNKARAIAAHFNWVHSVDRFKVAQKLNDGREAGSLNVCLQVNIDGAPTKSGVMPADLGELLEQCLALPNIRVRGLMAVPDAQPNFETQKAPFVRLAALLAQCQQRFPEAPLDTLSMGMSGDLEAAIAAGTTLVRVGTDVFGPRAAKSASIENK